MKKRIWMLLLLGGLLTVFAASGSYLASYYYGSRCQQTLYENLAETAERVRQGAEPGENVAAPAAGEDILPEYRELYAMNPELVGWIRIEGTRIDYPVVQSPARVGYYLTHDFTGAESAYGCVYAGEGCDLSDPTGCLILYGHHMADGSMFAGLADYQRRSFWERHALIHFDTLTERRTYRIFAVFRTTADGFPYHSFPDATDAAEFDAFIAACREHALYDTGILPQYGDQLLLLSTCEYSQENGRLVVAAVRIDLPS